MKIVPAKEKFERVSPKDFVRFSFLIYPIGVYLLLESGKIIEFFGKPWIYYSLAFLFFATINWLWGQKELKNALLIISCAIGITAYFVSLRYHENSMDIGIHVIQAIIVYFLGFLVFLFAQFFTWVPFLVKFLYQNRENLNNLEWE